MGNQLLRNTVFTTLLLFVCLVNAQDFSAKYENNTLKIESKYPTESLYLYFSFIDVDQLKINGGTSNTKRKGNPSISVDFKENEKELVLRTSKIKLAIEKSTRLISVVRLPNEVIWQGTFSLAPHPETKEQVLQVKSIGSLEEHFFGLGERLNGFDQKGKRVIMEIDDAWGRSNGKAYKAVPFYMSSRKYGLLVNSSERIIFDMAKESPDQALIIMPGKEIECFLFANDSPLQIMEDYTDITGKSPVIPNWSLEPWLSRRSHAGWTNTSYAKLELDQMENNGQHIGVILWEGIKHQFLKEQELSAYDLVNYWHDKNMKVVFYDRTGQITDTPENLEKYKYDDPSVKKYFLRDENGDLIKVGLGAIANPDADSKAYVYIDPTNPKAMDWWFQKNYEQKVMSDNGKSGPNGYNLDGIKIDFSELLPKDLKGYKTHKPAPGIANFHAVIFAEKVNDWLQKVKPEGGITWTRGGGLGLQRGGVFWNGDRIRNMSQLKGTISSLLAVSVSGLAYAGHDLGGYMRGDDPEAEETYIRGVQFTTFSPFFHDHGSAQAPREQNRYGRENYGFYTRVRYNILPYLQGLMLDAVQRGWPIMRPLFFYYPDDPQTWLLEDEYFLGKNLLIAPIVSKGTSRTVYLPEGNWIDFWTNESFKGNSQILVNKPLNQIPVFVREKAILPLALNENLEIGGEFNHKNKNKLRNTYKLFGLESGTSILPAGEDKQSTLKINKSNGKVSLRLDGMDKDFALIIPNMRPSSIKVNNTIISEIDKNFKQSGQAWKYDSSSSELKIKIETKNNISSYEIELLELPITDISFKVGANVAEISQPKTPNIVSIEAWSESVDIIFDKEDALDEKYIISYGKLGGSIRPNRASLNYGDKITIDGLDNGKMYFFRFWAENQLYRSLETDWFLMTPTNKKKPKHSYVGKGLFIKANHFSEKSVDDDGSKTFTFSVETDYQASVKIWVQLNKFSTHHDYDKWYETSDKTLNGSDTIEIEVPANHKLSRIFIAPEGETPFFNDGF